jgi:glycosyltransferase involved in cell wall biosynthesis
MPENRVPLISVLLPVFNAGATLAGALRSVARQSEKCWECVVLDDGSTDGTSGIALDAARHDPRFRVVSAPHRGLVGALNTGLGHCRGRYVARMDADDLMHRLRLAEQVALLGARPDLHVIGCHVRFFPRREAGPGYRAYESWLNGIDGEERLVRDLFIECPVAHPTLMIRRDTLLQFGYRDLGWPEDYDLILRMITGGQEIGMLPRRRLAWRHSEDRLSRRSPAYGQDRFTACKARYLARSFLARTERYILWGYGGTGRTLCRALLEHGKRPSHIVELHEGRLGNRIQGAEVIPRERLGSVPRLPLVVSVAGIGPRTEIRDALARFGLIETRDFVCAA